MIEIQNERETGPPKGGWVFDVIIRGAEGADACCHAVSLSWVDYEYWCHGAVPPAEVVRALVRWLIDQPGLKLPPRFDASTARRWKPDIDQALQFL